MYPGYRPRGRPRSDGTLQAIIFLPSQIAESLVRRGPAGRILAYAFLSGALLVLACLAWLEGPLTPANEWHPFIFGASLVGIAMAVQAFVATARAPEGKGEFTPPQSATAFLLEIAHAKKPVTVCTHCLRELDASEEDSCYTCGQRGSVMKITGERELKLLNALLQPSPDA